VLPAFPENLEYRRAQLHLRAWGELEQALKHLARRTSCDRLLATRTMGRAKCRVEHPQVVPKISHGADGGAGIVANGFLVDRNHGRQSLHKIDVWLAQLIDKALGVSGHRCE